MYSYLIEQYKSLVRAPGACAHVSREAVRSVVSWTNGARRLNLSCKQLATQPAYMCSAFPSRRSPGPMLDSAGFFFKDDRARELKESPCVTPVSLEFGPP